MQLPPVVQSSTAKSMGMDQSLFSLLQTPENTVPLSLQYRMNQSIQDIANFMTYEGHLECGNDQVANQQTTLIVSQILQITCNFTKLLNFFYFCKLRPISRNY